jgi:voltage-gated potassium channel
VWKQLESGRVVHEFEWVVLVATLALIPVIVIEEAVKGGGWKTFATAANWVIWGVFVAFLAFVLTVAPDKLAALRAHWLDAAIVVLTVPVFGSFLSSLRLLRLARLLRLLRLGVLLSRAIQAERSFSNRDVFRFAALITLLVVVIGGAAESLAETGEFPSLWDGVWWSVETVTTVGYGDLVPHTVEGRIIAMIAMVVGIGFVSVLTAAVASRFVRTDTGTDVERTLSRVEAELGEVKRELQTMTRLVSGLTAERP